MIGCYKELAFDITSTGCHECTSHFLDKNGYPVFRRKTKKWRVARWMYTQTFGAIPEGMVIRHKCDNPKCINPDHLELGSPFDNSADMLARGRSSLKKGGAPKLTDSQVKEIKLLANGPNRKSDAVIAKEFGVSDKTIMSIRRGWTWVYI